MRILWYGDEAIPEDLLPEGCLVVPVEAALQCASSSFSQDTVCLAAFGTPFNASLLDRLHRLHPCVPIGLVARNEDRAAAFELLRSRRIDRVVPYWDCDSDLGYHLEALAAHGTRLATLCRTLSGHGNPVVFLTGATGFLGGHFLRYLLRCSSARVFALTRTANGTPFDERLAHLTRIYPGRIAYVEGDLCLPGLGIDPTQRGKLTELVDAVWHFAADTRFEPILRDTLFRTNLEGTRNVIAFTRTLKRSCHFHHVSTAYVAGDGSTGSSVPEGPLARPTSFKNPYEESKYEAECAVAQSGLPTTIYRPSIILGERVSGLCDGQTVYKVAQLLRLARLAGRRNSSPEGQRFRVLVDPETTKNLIAADDVVVQMLQLAWGNPVAGRYYHLTQPEPTLMADLIAVIARLLDIPEYEAVSSLEGEALSVSEAVLKRISGVFKPYMLSADPCFTQGPRKVGAVPPMDSTLLQFLLQSFFEQHYDWEFRLAAVPV